MCIFIIHRIVSFTIEFLNCDSPDKFDEGVEFAIRWDGRGNWVPLGYYHNSNNIQNRPDDIFIGSISHILETPTIHFRGYDVPISKFSDRITVRLEICDSTNLKHNMIQFRWLQTTRFSSTKVVPVDVWTLDNVTVEFDNGSNKQVVLSETFDLGTLK